MKLKQKVRLRRRILECFIEHNPNEKYKDISTALDIQISVIMSDVEASDKLWCKNGVLYYGDKK